MKASVFGDIYPLRVKAILDEYKAGEPILGRLVQGKCGDILVIGRVVNAFRTADIINEYIQAKYISEQKDSPTAQSLIEHIGGVVLEVELITALKDNKRATLNFLLEHLSEVHFLEDFPIPPTPHTGYLGNFYGSDVKAPLVLQDFQTLKEAYHFFIAGQTGSGKSTFTQMLLSLYNKLNPNMNFLILDTVGEFTASFEGKRNMFLHLKDIWKGKVEIYTPPDTLALEGWDLFKEICLDYGVMHTIGVPGKSTDNVKWGIDAIVDILIGSIHKNTKHTSTRYMSPKLVEETFRQLIKDDEKLDKNFIKKVYKTDEARDRLRDIIKDPITFQKFVNKIKEIAELFYTDGGNKKTISDVISDFSTSVVNGHPGRCVVLNFTLHILHDKSNSLRVKYVRETLRALYSEGIDLYNQRGDVNLNTLVVLEEAHNYAPKYTDIDELKNLSNEIVKYFIETRKFGIGWACITTRPSNVRREIFEHARVKIIGMGLTSGSDVDLLKESFGSEFLNLYRLLPDPSDPLSPRKEVSFAISGPITVLSREGTDFITIYNNKEEFLKSNGF